MSTRDRRTVGSKGNGTKPFTVVDGGHQPEDPKSHLFKDMDDEDVSTEDGDEFDDDDEGCNCSSDGVCPQCGGDLEEDIGYGIMGVADQLLSSLVTLGQYRAVAKDPGAAEILDRLEHALLKHLNTAAGAVEQVGFSFDNCEGSGDDPSALS